MIDSAAASIEIVETPHLSISCLLELRAFLDAGLACFPEAVDPEGGADGERPDKHATGSVRGTADQRTAGADRPREGVGAA
jgi:hypothetical protein